MGPWRPHAYIGCQSRRDSRHELPKQLDEFETFVPPVSTVTFGAWSHQPGISVLGLGCSRSLINCSMTRAGYRRCPPRVARYGSLPSFAQRATVFGDTCRRVATSEALRYNSMLNVCSLRDRSERPESGASVHDGKDWSPSVT